MTTLPNVILTIIMMIHCTLATTAEVQDNKKDNHAQSDGAHVIMFGRDENGIRESMLFHIACQLGYTGAKLLKSVCGTSVCLNDIYTLKEHLSSLPPHHMAVLVDVRDDYAYLMATPPDVRHKLHSLGHHGVVVFSHHQDTSLSNSTKEQSQTNDNQDTKKPVKQLTDSQNTDQVTLTDDQKQIDEEVAKKMKYLNDKGKKTYINNNYNNNNNPDKDNERKNKENMKKKTEKQKKNVKEDETNMEEKDTSPTMEDNIEEDLPVNRTMTIYDAVNEKVVSGRTEDDGEVDDNIAEKIKPSRVLGSSTKDASVYIQESASVVGEDEDEKEAHAVLTFHKVIQGGVALGTVQKLLEALSGEVMIVEDRLYEPEEDYTAEATTKSQWSTVINNIKEDVYNDKKGIEPKKKKDDKADYKPTIPIIVNDTLSQHILFLHNLKGDIGVGVPLKAHYKEHNSGLTSHPIILINPRQDLDTYNIIQVSQDVPVQCSYSSFKDRTVASGSEKDDLSQPMSGEPVVLLVLKVQQWTPFLEEVINGITQQNFPKRLIHFIILTNVGLHEREIAHLQDTFQDDYRVLKVVLDVAMDISEIKSECDAAECRFVITVASQVQLTNPNTFSTLLKMNRPILSPLLQGRGKMPGHNFVYSPTEADHQMTQVISRGQFRAVFQVHQTSGLRVIQSEALQRVIGHEQVGEYITNEEKFGFMLNTGGARPGRLHQDLWGMLHNAVMWKHRYIHPQLLAMIKKEIQPEQIGPYMYYIPTFTERYCRELVEEMEHYGKWFDKQEDGREEGHNYSSRNINLSDINYANAFNLVIDSIFKDLLSSLYPGHSGDSEPSLSFVLKYSANTSYGTFKEHLDGATYTYNIALNNDFTGGGLQFKFGNKNFEEEETLVVPHNKTGWGVVHPNRPFHVHRGMPLEDGLRYAFINIIHTSDDTSKGGPRW